jgi:GxxExxY protein
MTYERTLPALPHAALTDRILNVFFKTFEELGHGFLESVLSRAMQIALTEAGMQVLKEHELDVQFHGHTIGRCFADLIVDRTVLIEVKGTSTIEGYAEAQILNYLKMCGGGVGLLLNFGRRPQFKRFVMGDPTNSLPVLAGQSHGEL